MGESGVKGGSTLVVVLAAALLLAVVACGPGEPPGHERSVIVLGIDGMDHGLTQRLMEEGALPNLQRLAARGTFQPLGTSIPPQSPVAWSDFITGMDAGGHGIYDFVHREPDTMVPYPSTTSTQEAGRTLTIGGWQIPLSGGSVELLRRGTAFWEVLDEHGVPATIIRMPANFPPSGSAARELSGMGTPDIIGSLGTYTFFSSDPLRLPGGDLSNEAQVVPVRVRDGVVEAELVGPQHPLRVEEEDLTSPFTVYVDPERPVAKLVVGDEEVILQEGEWSDWVTVEFELIPYVQSVSAIARFYLKETRREFELYVSPLQIDPLDPVMPISHPEGYAAELADATGRFYTQGMPEDTNIFNDGIFDTDEFVAQAAITGSEIREQFDYVMDHFHGGLLFYYWGNVDQVSHMLWRTIDPEHPGHDPERDAPYADVIRNLYLQVDELVGETMARIDDDTLLVVMSDHGFASWTRAFNLSTWLVEEGYIRLRNPRRRAGTSIFTNVDWSRTRAYALGLNSLYINLQGRDRYGTVPPSEREGLIQEIKERLLAYRDPETGEPAVTRVYVRDEVYEDRGMRSVGPDIIVGYAKGVRSDSDSALGEFSEEVMFDNMDPWSGDHLMDHRTVPGVLFTSRPLQRPAPALKDLAAALLAEFGVEDFPRRDELTTATAGARE